MGIGKFRVPTTGKIEEMRKEAGIHKTAFSELAGRSPSHWHYVTANDGEVGVQTAKDYLEVLREEAEA